MTTGLSLVVTTLVVLVTSCRGDAVDGTRQPGTKGPDVVNAVVDLIKAKCVFPEDRLFLRRLAYVESQDGYDPDTYKAGYNGGIWRVSESMFNATSTCPAVIRPTCDTIQRELGIDWTKVTWSDLRKPLYSGLAASLYLMERMGNNTPTIPATLKDQAHLWTQRYHSGGRAPDRDFESFVAHVTQYECQTPMDIAFIVDSSGSIENADFDLSMDFVADVVNALSVPDVARVSTVIFDSFPTVEFTFNAHSSKAEVVAAIRNITRTSGGTNTAFALNVTRGSVFTVAAGARPNAKRVAVLVTDGESADPNATAAEAELLRQDSGVVVFTIGVGGYDRKELLAIASEPQCSHTYTLSDFSAIQSIIYEIERSTCRAATYLRPDHHLTISNGTTQISTTGGKGGMEVNVNCGIAHVYLSYTNPNPNPALYAEMYTATDGHPAYLTTSTSNAGRPVYMTVVGSNLPPDAAKLKNCTDFSATITHNKEASIMCEVNHECRRCTDDQIRQNSRIRELISCNDFSRYEFTNPCSRAGAAAGHVVFPYAYSPNMFIRCDYMGRPYLTLCPQRMTFDPYTLTCGFESGIEKGRVPLPSTYPNPCTPAHIQAEYFYFEYTPDRTKFIHCDLWGNAWLEHCPVLQVWDQKLLTCVADRPNQAATTSAPVTVTNPCTKEALSAGNLFHPYPCDHTRFIHCDMVGNFYVQFCPQGMFYDPMSYLCVRGDPQTNQHGCD